MALAGSGERQLAPDRRSLVREPVEWLLFAVLPAVVVGILIGTAMLDSESRWAFDFRQFWQGGKDVLDGVSPYPSRALLETAGDHLGPEGIQDVFRFPYPASAAVALAPFGLMAFDTAAVVWAVLLVVSLFAAIWILEVRDWRVVGVILGSAPVIGAVGIGTLTPLLILLLAVAWRWRNRFWIGGSALAVAISLKLFLWPLVVWLVATRRWAAAAFGAGLAAALALGAWAAIGFEGLADYPELLRRLADVVEDRGFSLVALGAEAGLPQGLAQALPWLVGLPLLAAAVLLARREDGDRRSFSVAVLASIALTPIVWLHYFALLIVPLALARPRLSLAWALLVVFWLIPSQESQGDLWRIVIAVAVTAVAVAVAASKRPLLLRHR